MSWCLLSARISVAIDRIEMGRRWWCHQMEKNPRYWPFVRGIHQSPVDSPHIGQWRGALMFYFICAQTIEQQSWCGWYETPSRSFWRHSNVIVHLPYARSTSCNIVRPIMVKVIVRRVMAKVHSAAKLWLLLQCGRYICKYLRTSVTAILTLLRLRVRWNILNRVLYAVIGLMWRQAFEV